MSRSVLGEFGVVIVEPDGVERSRLADLFATTAGFQVIGEAASGTQAVEIAAARRPDLVLLRLVLPDLGGYAVASLLTARVPGVTIVAVAGEGEEAAGRLAARMGAVGCVAAGSSDQVVVDTVRRALGAALVGRRAERAWPAGERTPPPDSLSGKPTDW
jgi:two-component system chemotaxis response regulator CheY